MKALAAVSGYLGLFLIGVSILFFASQFPEAGLLNSALWIGFLVLGAAGLVVFLALRWRSLLEGMSSRSSFYGLNMALLIVVVLCIVAFANLIANNRNKRFDLTESGRNSLSKGSAEFLANLVDDATVYFFFNNSPLIASDVQQAMKMLNNLRHASKTVRVVSVNLDDQPELAATFEINTVPTAIIRSETNRDTINQVDEESVINAIVKTTRRKAVTLYFTAGHGEIDLNQQEGLRQELARDGYAAETVHLAQGLGHVEPGESVLVTMLPRADFMESEIAVLQDYLERGGRYFVSLAPVYGDVDWNANLRQLLSRYGIDAPRAKIAREMQVLDFGLFKGVSPMVLTKWDETNPITRRFTTGQLQINNAQPFRLAAEVPDGVQVTSLIESTDDYWAETTLIAPTLERRQPPPDVFDSAEDIPGPVSVAIAATKPVADHEMRLVAIGELQSIFDFGGGALFFNIINWLGDQGDLIVVERPQEGFRPLILSKNQMIFVYGSTVFGFPVLALAIGIIVVTFRRSRAS